MEIKVSIQHPESENWHEFVVDCNTDPEDFFVENIRLLSDGLLREINVSEKLYELLEKAALKEFDNPLNSFFYDEEETW